MEANEVFGIAMLFVGVFVKVSGFAARFKSRLRMRLTQTELK